MAQSAYIIKKKRKKRWIIILPLSIFTLIIAAIIHIIVNINPILETLTAEEVKSTTVVLLSDALKSVMGDNITYDDIIGIERDKEDKIESLSVDMILINNIARDTTLVAQSKLKSIGNIETNIPIGTLSGITFLSGLGPEINIKFFPTGTVNITFKSTFESVGINNTLHNITMIIDTSVNVVIPGLTRNLNLKTEVPMVNTVIVGRVPDTYLNSDRLDGMLNLVP